MSHIDTKIINEPVGNEQSIRISVPIGSKFLSVSGGDYLEIAYWVPNSTVGIATEDYRIRTIDEVYQAPNLELRSGYVDTWVYLGSARYRGTYHIFYQRRVGDNEEKEIT